MILRDRIVLITGGAGGVGSALAQRLVDEGANVFSFDLHAPEKPVHGVTYRIVDITKSEDICAAVKAMPHPIDCIVNNAGVMRRGKIFETSEPDWDFLFSVNVKAPWLILKCAQPFLSQDATIVTVSSKHGMYLVADPAVYALTKSAVLTLSNIIALTYPSYQCKVACFGPIDTALHHFGRDASYLQKEKEAGNVCATVDAADMLFKLLTSHARELRFNPDTCAYSFVE